VLDTATGLGYTAIELAKTATRVLTIELDPLVIEIAQLNPWSAALFTSAVIDQRIADAANAIVSFEARSFDAILHDPPTLSLAGDLYGAAFYQELFRVLRPGVRQASRGSHPALKPSATPRTAPEPSHACAA
jgi:predicted methyltransferase